MKKLYIYSLAAAALMATACSKENPFTGPESSEEGQILKSAIAVDMKVDETVRKNVRTRADVNLDDFTVIFTKEGQTTPVKKFKYSEMPDVVTLPVGDYICTATLGENRLAEWENPYFLGRSDSFTVNPYEITSYVAPIECRLENIKVTIEFDPALKSRMSADSYVEVKVGDNSGLNFTLTEAEAGKAGYFMHTAETTLVATFNGKIDGAKAVETKSLKDVAKGNHYKITFKLHDYSNDPTGDSDADIQVDASVTITDIERNVEIGDEPLLDDSERPSEEPENPGPGPDEPKAEAPEIEGVAPIDLDKLNTIDGSVPVGMKVVSTAEGGFTAFDVVIESPDLTPEELEGVGLAANLNLAETPEQFAAPLTNFGFPVNVKGKKEANIEISTMLLGMLKAVGAGHEHKFIITVTDANGTTEKTLRLYIPE